MATKKVYFPKIRLVELVTAPGGLSRDDAVTATMQNMQAISGEGNTAMIVSIQAIEAILAATKGRQEPEALEAILPHADQIVTLAGTFGYDYLDGAARSLCDTLDAMLAAKIFDIAPALVHLDAMRLFAPGKEGPQGPAAEGILAELSRVQAHYRARA